MTETTGSLSSTQPPATAPTPRQKTVLITGCSSGIGLALAKALTDLRWRVFGCTRRNDTIGTLREMGVTPVVMDVNDAEQVRQGLAQIERDAGSLDMLVNNAGYGQMGPLLELSHEQLHAQFSTNLFAPMTLVRHAVPLMLKQQSGYIVNIGSISGITPTPFSGAYCASKAALHCLSDALRMELAPFNIKVITVMPGAIRSQFGDTASKHVEQMIKPDSLYKQFAHGIRKRAGISQTNPTPAEELARRLATILNRPGDKPSVIKFGRGSTSLPLLKRLLPDNWLDQILMRKFGLK